MNDYAYKLLKERIEERQEIRLRIIKNRAGIGNMSFHNSGDEWDTGLYRHVKKAKKKKPKMLYNSGDRVLLKPWRWCIQNAKMGEPSLVHGMERYFGKTVTIKRMEGIRVFTIVEGEGRDNYHFSTNWIESRESLLDEELFEI